jgi:hypothetical protein
MNGVFSFGCDQRGYVRVNKRIRTDWRPSMLTRIAIAGLAISLLGASAFALAPLEPAKAPEASPGTTIGQPAGHTVMEKNSVWPLKTRMSMDPCSVTVCQEA